MPKPRHKKRKFIDPKNERTTTFKLIHRSQKDPLAADEEAPQRVLQPINQDLEKRKEEERKWGVFYPDEYDYMQHLKDRGQDGPDFSQMDKFLLTKPGDDDDDDEDQERERKKKEKKTQQLPSRVQLPASVLPSDLPEEDVGLLNKAAPRSGPRLDWDPDIVAAMDEDFDFEDPENQLEDDFMDLANGSDYDDEDDDEDEERDFDSDDLGGRSSDEADDDVASLNGHRHKFFQNFEEEETRSRFTAYSMSSSVIRRNQGLTNLDDQFEKFYEGYDDENVGALECDDLEGTKPEDSDVMRQVMEEYDRNKASERVAHPEVEKTKALARILERQNEEENNDDGNNAMPEMVLVRKEEKWDCESVLSTYSNLYNHPKLISERKPEPIRISGKTGMPKDVLGKGLTLGALKRLDAENNQLKGGVVDRETATLASRVSELSFRNKYETKEEKKARKEGMKEYKRERRLERKANRDAFKEEKSRQEKIIMNNAKNGLGKKIL